MSNLPFVCFPPEVLQAHFHFHLAPAKMESKDQIFAERVKNDIRFGIN